jgi:hypothetical protein
MSDKSPAKKAAKGESLESFVKKHLADRSAKLNKQPSAIANGGFDKILKDVCETITNATPNFKRVAVVTVLGKCGSRAKESDLAIK